MSKIIIKISSKGASTPTLLTANDIDSMTLTMTHAYDSLISQEIHELMINGPLTMGKMTIDQKFGS